MWRHLHFNRVEAYIQGKTVITIPQSEVGPETAGEFGIKQPSLAEQAHQPFSAGAGLVDSELAAISEPTPLCGTVGNVKQEIWKNCLQHIYISLEIYPQLNINLFFLNFYGNQRSFKHKLENA